MINKAKFQVKNLSFPDAIEDIHPNAVLEAKSDWAHMLKHQIVNLAEFEEYWPKAMEVMTWIRD